MFDQKIILRTKSSLTSKPVHKQCLNRVKTSNLDLSQGFYWLMYRLWAMLVYPARYKVSESFSYDFWALLKVRNSDSIVRINMPFPPVLAQQINYLRKQWRLLILYLDRNITSHDWIITIVLELKSKLLCLLTCHDIYLHVLT